MNSIDNRDNLFRNFIELKKVSHTIVEEFEMAKLQIEGYEKKQERQFEQIKTTETFMQHICKCGSPSPYKNRNKTLSPIKSPVKKSKADDAQTPITLERSAKSTKSVKLMTCSESYKSLKCHNVNEQTLASNVGYDTTNNTKGKEYMRKIKPKLHVFRECLTILEEQFKAILEYNFLLENSIMDCNRFFKNFQQPLNLMVELKNNRQKIDMMSTIYKEEQIKSNKNIEILKNRISVQSIPTRLELKNDCYALREIYEIQNIALDNFQVSFGKFDKLNQDKLAEQYVNMKKSQSFIKQKHYNIQDKYIGEMAKMEHTFPIATDFINNTDVEDGEFNIDLLKNDKELFDKYIKMVDKKTLELKGEMSAISNQYESKEENKFFLIGKLKDLINSIKNIDNRIFQKKEGLKSFNIENEMPNNEININRRVENKLICKDIEELKEQRRGYDKKTELVTLQIDQVENDLSQIKNKSENSMQLLRKFKSSLTNQLKTINEEIGSHSYKIEYDNNYIPGKLDIVGTMVALKDSKNDRNRLVYKKSSLLVNEIGMKLNMKLAENQSHSFKAYLCPKTNDSQDDNEKDQEIQSRKQVCIIGQENVNKNTAGRLNDFENVAIEEIEFLFENNDKDGHTYIQSMFEETQLTHAENIDMQSATQISEDEPAILFDPKFTPINHYKDTSNFIDNETSSMMKNSGINQFQQAEKSPVEFVRNYDSTDNVGDTSFGNNQNDYLDINEEEFIQKISDRIPCDLDQTNDRSAKLDCKKKHGNKKKYMSLLVKEEGLKFKRNIPSKSVLIDKTSNKESNIYSSRQTNRLRNNREYALAQIAYEKVIKSRNEEEFKIRSNSYLGNYLNDAKEKSQKKKTNKKTKTNKKNVTTAKKNLDSINLRNFKYLSEFSNAGYTSCENNNNIEEILYQKSKTSTQKDKHHKQAKSTADENFESTAKLTVSSVDKEILDRFEKKNSATNIIHFESSNSILIDRLATNNRLVEVNLSKDKQSSNLHLKNSDSKSSNFFKHKTSAGKLELSSYTKDLKSIDEKISEIDLKKESIMRKFADPQKRKENMHLDCHNKSYRSKSNNSKEDYPDRVINYSHLDMVANEKGYMQRGLNSNKKNNTVSMAVPQKHLR